MSYPEIHSEYRCQTLKKIQRTDMLNSNHPLRVSRSPYKFEKYRINFVSNAFNETPPNGRCSSLSHRAFSSRSGKSNVACETDEKSSSASRRFLQFSVLHAGCSLQSIRRPQSSFDTPIRRPVSHLSSSRLSSFSDHIVNPPQCGRSKTISTKKVGSFVTSFFQRETPARCVSGHKGSHFLAPRKATSDIATKATHFVPRTQTNLLSARKISNKDDLLRKYWSKHIINLQLQESQRSYDISECPRTPTLRSMTPDEVRKIHDIFHKQNSKSFNQNYSMRNNIEARQHEAIGAYNFYNIKPEVERIKASGSHKLIRKFRSNEESRVCEILKEVFAESGGKCQRSTARHHHHCSGDNDEIILKPFLRWIESQNIETAVRGTSRMEIRNSNASADETPQKTSKEVENLSEDLQVPTEDGDLNVDLNDNGNNQDHTEQELQESNDDESFDLSDDRLQALLMPLVLNFLSGK